jgi:hypothetical protein
MCGRANLKTQCNTAESEAEKGIRDSPHYLTSSRSHLDPLNRSVGGSGISFSSSVPPALSLASLESLRHPGTLEKICALLKNRRTTELVP